MLLVLLRALIVHTGLSWLVARLERPSFMLAAGCAFFQVQEAAILLLIFMFKLSS